MPANSLLRSEDWWAVWFGFFLIVLATGGVITDIPKPAQWTTNPFEAFPSTTLLNVMVLWLGLTLLTTLGIRATG